MDIYKDAIVAKTSPIIMKTASSSESTMVPVPTKEPSLVPSFPLDASGNPIKTPMLDANGNPMFDSAGNPIYVGENNTPIYVDANGNPIASNMVGQTTPISSVVNVDTQSKEHQMILEKEKIIEDLIRQYNEQQQQQGQRMLAQGQGQPEDTEANNVAVDFFLKMVKTYFALVLKFGDTVASTVIRMTMPAQIADPIISNTPLNVAELVKTADRVNQVLANPAFKTELGYMFDNTSNAVNPQIKMLLNKMADIVMDVAGKTGTKLASTAAISLSAFPPFAVVFDIANLMSVGINAMSSGINMVSTATNSGAKVLGAFNNAPSIDMNKYMANTVDRSKKPVTTTATPIPAKPMKGGEIEGIPEVGKKILIDMGGEKAIDVINKTNNVFENVKNNVNEWITEYTKPPSSKQTGGKKTRRSINRIRKTMREFTRVAKPTKKRRKY